MIKPIDKQISLIVAVARNQAIGLNNRMLWHIPADFRWFKRHTSGHPVVMGRRTWESLPVRPLPGRKNIVLSRAESDAFVGAIHVGSMEDAWNQMDPDGENFIIGGESVYRDFLPLAQKVYLTHVDRDYEADAWFPQLDMQEWSEVFREEHPEEEPGFVFLVYERRG